MTTDAESFIEQLLGQMTLEEKIGQLNQVSGGDGADLELVRQGRMGSLLNASGALTGQSTGAPSEGAEGKNRLQQLALQSRLRIPLLFGRDVIHGYRTVFPIPLAQAAAFNLELTETAAAIAARESSADGVKWTFAPMIDIARDPRWGRVAEGHGEDPFLGAAMAAALVRGFQGRDMAQPDKLVACAKHFVGYGAAEGGRDYDAGEISEPTLRDVYLPPYEAAVQAGVGTIMSAFIDLNGVPATANRHLLTDVLRGEWGFDGFVVSDWDSVGELTNHGVAADRTAAAALALNAGLDMDMVSRVYLQELATAVQTGQTSIATLDRAVLRVLRIKARAGLFDNPFSDPARAAREILTDDARQVARRFARETMVLLKNQGEILPLEGFRRILVAGNFAHARGELFGTWTADGRWEDVTALQEGVRRCAPRGVEVWTADDPVLALDAAQQADAVVLAIGEHPRRSGENANVSHLGLPPGQAAFIDAMAGLGKPLVLVVFAGRPLAIARQLAQADAVLYAWHPGIEGAGALGELLFGLHAPLGRLPITFPRATGQVPIYYNQKNSGRPVTPDGLFKTRYVDLPSSPLFPFGYGLGYTAFHYANLEVSSPVLRGALQISADVSNIGRRAGSELAQLYVRDLVGSLTRPVRELKGFARLTLAPGETQRVTFTLTEEMLAFTRADGTRGVEPGQFHVWIGPHSADGLQGEFRL